jgi:thiamine transport system permease protein
VTDASTTGLAVAAALGTAVVLVLVLYLPVGVVFAEAFGGPRPFASFGRVLTDPFYTGVLAEVLDRPLAVGYHAGNVLAWVGAVSIGLDGVHAPPLRKGLFGFTAYQAALSTVVSVVVGLPGAYVLANYEFRGRRALRSLTIVPFVLPGIMVASGFYAAFGRSGLLNDALGVVGAGPQTLL